MPARMLSYCEEFVHDPRDCSRRLPRGPDIRTLFFCAKYAGHKREGQHNGHGLITPQASWAVVLSLVRCSLPPTVLAGFGFESRNPIRLYRRLDRSGICANAVHLILGCALHQSGTVGGSRRFCPEVNGRATNRDRTGDSMAPILTFRRNVEK